MTLLLPGDRRLIVDDGAADAASLLASAALYLDVANYDGTQTFKNLGTGGSALDGRIGSGTGSDSNDPAWNAFAGTPYVYLPGLANNSMSLSTIASIAASGDKFVWADVELPDWTPAASASRFIGIRGSSTAGWEFVIRSTGNLEFQFRDSGTASWRGFQSDVTVGFTDGTRNRIGASIDVDNGAGGYTVRFWKSTDLGVTWTQIGTDRTAATVATIANSTDNIEIGVRASSNDPLVGKVYAAGVFNAITADGKPSGSAALTVDCSVLTSGSATSFTATTGQTVTINRATSGRKTVAVVPPSLLLGTDDYIEVSDNAALDVDASTSLSVLMVMRRWATPVSNSVLIGKRSSSGSGWVLRGDGTNHALVMVPSDGTNNATGLSPSSSAGALAVYVAVLNRSTQTVYTILNGVSGSTSPISAVGSLDNSNPVNIGRRPTAGTDYSDFEFYAAAIWKNRVISPAEAVALTNHFRGRYR